ncbi:MAG: YfhO family protein [Blastocatellia bacterium]
MVDLVSAGFRQRLRAELFPLIILCLLTVLFFTPRFFGKSFSAVAQHMFISYPWAGVTIPNYGVSMRGHTQSDHAETYYPLSVFATDAWRRGEIPMWMPYSFGGLPIMELGMTSLLYPPRLALAFFFSPIQQLQLMMFLHLLLAALGMYALMRCWGANQAGSVMAAVVWQFNGHNTFWLVMEQMAIVAAWCPWMLLAATLAVRRKSFKWAVIAGLAVAMALYSGGVHYVHLSGWLLAAWYGTAILREAVRAFRQRRHSQAIQYLSLPAVSLVTALVVGLAYWLPLLKSLSEVSRAPMSLGAQLSMASSWSEVFQALWLPRSAFEVAGKPDYISFLFIGLIPLALALAGIIWNRSLHVRLAMLFAVMAGMFAIGVSWLVGLLHNHLPFFGTMYLYVAPYVYCFALAVLAGFGLSELVERWSAKSGVSFSRAFVVLVGLAGIIQTAALLRAYNQVFHGKVWALLFSFRAAVLLAVGIAVLAAGRVYWTKLSPKLPWPSYAAIGVATANLFLFAWLTIPYQWASPTWFFPETPLVSTLRKVEGERRFLPLYRNTETWTPPVLSGKTATVFRLHSGSGYESLLPSRTMMLWRAVQVGEHSKMPSVLAESAAGSYRPYFNFNQLPVSLLENLSVGLFVTPPKVEPIDSQSKENLVANGTLRPVYQGADGTIYENLRAVPRAFLVPRTQPVADRDQAFQTLVNPEFDARNSAIIEAPLSQQESALLSATESATSSAHIVRESLNRVEIETASSSGQVLVLNDSWASGWKAIVDGTEQTVHRVNFNSRGVVLPAGNHRVVFQYRPMLLLAGLWVSGLTLLVLMVWLIVWPIFGWVGSRPRLL